MRPFVVLAALAVVLGAGASPAAAGGCTGLVQGTNASERLAVSAAATHVLGMAGDDLITGGAGRDCLEGGAGRDLLSGRGASDTIVGGPGDDRLAGGSGADRLIDAPTEYAYGMFASGRNRVAAGPGADHVNVANGRRDIVRCGPGRDRVTADRADRLSGCERKRILASPLPATTPHRGGRTTMFLVRFRAIEQVASTGESFSISVTGPPGCGRIEASSLGLRYGRDAIVRYRLKPFSGEGQRAARWCRGLYRGSASFEQVLSGGCGTMTAAPAAGCTVGVRVGRFWFRVR